MDSKEIIKDYLRSLDEGFGKVQLWEQTLIVEKKEKKAITIDELVNLYVDYFLVRARPWVVYDDEWLSVKLIDYPMITDLIGDRYIELDEESDIFIASESKTVLHNVSTTLFTYLSKEIEIKFNQKSIVNGRISNIGNIPCFIIEGKVERIYTKEDFDNWMNLLNEDGKELDLGLLYQWTKESIDIVAKYRGTQEDLQRIPKSIQLLVGHYITYNENYTEYIVSNLDLQVMIDVDNIIHVRYEKEKLYFDYFNELVYDINRINYKIAGYDVVSGNLYQKAKALFENNYNSGGIRVKRIIVGEEAYMLAKQEDRNVWDGCIGSVVMMDVPESEINKHVHMLEYTEGFLIELGREKA
nr:hypothetical protein [uncultured Prevotella sp.]